MKTEAEDIEMLAQAIMLEAKDEAEQLQVEAKEKADAIHQYLIAQQRKLYADSSNIVGPKKN